MSASADYLQEYHKTETAYTEGNLEEAATLVCQLVEDYPDDPSARLLCGHIYYDLQQYDVAREQYNAVLTLTDDPELLDQAQAYMTEADQLSSSSDPPNGSGAPPPDDDDFDDATETILEDFNGDEPAAEPVGIESEPDLAADIADDLSDLDIDIESLSPPPERVAEAEERELDLEEEELNPEEMDFSQPFEEAMEMSPAGEAGADEDLEDLDLGIPAMSEPELDGGMPEDDWELDSSDLSQPDLGGGDFDAIAFESDPLADAGAELDEYEADSDLTNPLNNPFAELEGDGADDGEEGVVGETDWETGDPFGLAAEIPGEDESDNHFAPPEGEFPDDDLDGLSGDLFKDEAIAPELKGPGLSGADLGATEPEPESDRFELDDLSPESEPSNGNGNGPRPIAPDAGSETLSGDPDLGEFDDELDDIFAPLEEPAPPGTEEEAEIPRTAAHRQNGKAAIAEDFDESPFDMMELDGEAEADDEAETLLTDSSRGVGPVFEEDSDFDLDGADIPAFAEPPDLDADDDIPDSFNLDALDEETFEENGAGPPRDWAKPTAKGDRNGSVPPPAATGIASHSQTTDDFLDDFEEFDDLGHLPDFEVSPEEASAFLPDSSDFEDDNLESQFIATTTSNLESDSSAIHEDEELMTPTERETLTTFTAPSEDHVDTSLSVEPGSFAFLENKPLKIKSLYTALGTGLVTLIAVAVATNVATQIAARNDRALVVNYLRTTGWIMTAVAGAASFGTAWTVGRITAGQMGKASKELQAQFDAIARGNLDARVNVYAEDELGQMCAKFNHMAQFIQSTTREAQRKAEEQEEAKENLQRQVIRLLDDVEGAARGDLTVSAEVTADVLGAVADSFNLTIQNLREIVVQVKQAARQVSKGATDSASFAKDVAGDALRQAEELAATLNSVQLLTDAIQRVAESAKEAEEVARSAAAVATKGGEAVQMTVAGILKIRETVAETTRDVKRLAESSQEISKIVAIISNIASRTNLLALNASIEAARAGEAGRGFAIVADEVRQLADKSAKSLKEIEQIVMQIQSQTSSVMMAMEEGNQQVIEGTKLAEQAKRSLDDIIQVTNRIDVLVRSITADTVEQNETARAVAQVMQAVEHSAQETSQEAHRVASALSNLVGVARDLLTSVERFRVDPSERQ
ncbi:methyl-accepting chemotaxis protein [Lyngbya sp. CCY1209]|uniref:methyl-accepting chemotaxis protein n=1 Tax=Lyngbya sp. CCY1209 TaxID=2886103 RepID=UPI002D1FDA26|nr:methyl-accepting chemotaxis protein [Lyngbya sp. CCY1209]MEB3885341.1 methyl-accepting chemotaxis protein [Lyngbya sp. CCY1209]